MTALITMVARGRPALCQAWADALVCHCSVSSATLTALVAPRTLLTEQWHTPLSVPRASGTGRYFGSGLSKRSPAFSLIEMMIAIVILGLGLVMVATMFPIALGRARALSEFTRQTAIANAAETTIGMLAQVDGLTLNAATFAGDLVYDAPPPPPNLNSVGLMARSDTRVHLLHMENLLISPRVIVPNRLTPWADPLAPWHLSPPDLVAYAAADLVAACEDGFVPPTIDVNLCHATFLSARIRLELRVYPPLRPRDNVDIEGVFDTPTPSKPDTAWDEMFETRRYAWTVLHRLREPVGPSQYPLKPTPIYEQEAEASADLPRKLDVYYVTLRRPQAVLRYAKQDPTTAPDPFILPDDPIVIPTAQPADDDVLLPEPWRVQVQLPAALETLAPDTTTGIPTEIVVPPPTIVDAPGYSTEAHIMLAQMFQRKTQFIDEITGQIYRVVKRRLGPDEMTVILTLDREITLEDIDLPLQGTLGFNNPLCPSSLTLTEQADAGLPVVADRCELLRTVWVFPPPVQQTRLGSDALIFDGPQPVVGIDIRPLTLSPRR